MTSGIEFVAETGSTNADLSARIARGEAVPDCCWLVADRQTAGHGRHGRPWLDAPGNFMGSAAVRIEPGDPPLPSLSFVAALAVYQALLPHCADPAALRLKWPNDVLLAGGKLAGILLERVGHHAVIGIGVNLVAAPEVLGRNVASLPHSGTTAFRDAFAHDLARWMVREVQQWRAAGPQPVFRRWLAAAHPPGTPLCVHAPDGQQVAGTFEGLAEDGALRLRLADGTTHVIRAGDVMLEGQISG